TFAREYPTLYPIVPQAAAQLPQAGPTPILSMLVQKLPWFHHVILMEKVKDRATRIWYMQRAIVHGWSRAVHSVQIETRAHNRSGKAVTNFAETLPPVPSDLAQEVLKDPYTFDFLTLFPDARERELEQGLTEHIQKFLVELGVGFAFVGRQVWPVTDQRRPPHSCSQRTPLFRLSYSP
ncbi:MAG: PDDEXK nuclease domain-containing protein, partial [Opitutaceae bacterium]